MAGRYSTVVKDGSNFIGFSGLCQRSDVPGRHKDFKQWWDCTGMELTVFTCPQVCYALSVTQYEAGDEIHCIKLYIL